MHVEGAVTLREALGGLSPPAAAYLTWFPVPVPNLLPELALALLTSFLSAYTAEKVLVVGYVITFPLAFLYALAWCQARRGLARTLRRCRDVQPAGELRLLQLHLLDGAVPRRGGLLASATRERVTQALGRAGRPARGDVPHPRGGLPRSGPLRRRGSRVAASGPSLRTRVNVTLLVLPAALLVLASIAGSPGSCRSGRWRRGGRGSGRRSA